MRIRLIALPLALAIAGSFVTVGTAHAAPSMPTIEKTTVVAEDGTTMIEHGVEETGFTVFGNTYVEFPEGGGTWYHGVKDKSVYSNFYHYTRKHGSSVKDGDGLLTRSKDVGPRETSNSSRKASFAGNSAYYRFG